MKIITVIGARPQFIKAATVSRIAKSYEKIDEKIIHTGQHYDKNMSEIFFDQLEIPVPDYNLEVGSGSHGIQTGKMLAGIEQILMKEKPDWVLVYGDTNSTIAAALAASKLHIKVAHVEAGLRSFNMKMPEEINRITTDRISDILFAPTQNAMNLLKKENLFSKAVFTGDVMLDSVIFYKEKINKNKEKYKLENLPENYYLATIHRPQNTDVPDNLRSIFKAFSEFNKEVILPLHPRTKNILKDLDIDSKNVKIIDPVGYLEMLNLVMDSDMVFTDSGGLQKETYFLGKKCVTMRTETEWIETLHDGWNQIVGADYDKIISAEKDMITSENDLKKFGGGKAAEVILKSL